MPELADITGAVSGSLLITTGRWFNKLRPSGKVAKAPAYKTGFSYDEFAYGEDKAEQFQPDGVPLYDSIICAPSTRVLAIDVDYPEALSFSRLGHVLPGARERAISTRGDHFHVILDMRAIDPADWPQQGRTAWGDIKAAGFIPMPGSCHYSGVPYAPVMADYPRGAASREEWLAAATASVARQAVVADAELITALKVDRMAHARDRLVQATQNGTNPRALGVRDVNGAWVYASGYVQGTWDQLPDGFLAHDDELKDLAWDMGLRGIERVAVHSEWRRLAGTLDASDPWTDKDFERHWRHVPGVHAELVERAEQDAIGWDRLDPDASLRNAALDRARRRIDAQQPVNNPSGFDEHFTPGLELLAPIPLFAAEAGVNERRAHNDAFIGWGPFDPQGATDSAHAWAVLERTFPIARYDPDADVWMSRDLDRWLLCTGDIMRGLVTDVIDKPAPDWPARMPYGMTKEQASANEHGHSEDIIKAERRRHENWVKFHSTSGIGAIAGYASALLRSGKRHPSHVSIRELDTDPAELWAGGECWDLRASGEQPVRKAFPKDHNGNEHKPIHLKTAACAPWHVAPEDEERLLPLWTELTTAIWPDDDVREWALLCLAAGLTGDPKKVIPVLQGGADRGKSTIAMALLAVLGSYGNVVNPKIVDGDTSGHDTIFMELMGCRFAFIDEGPKAGRAATNRLKRLAGGAPITANRMRKDPVTFNPTHTLCIALNPEERLPLDDPAVLNRVRFIPCDGDPDDVVAAARQLDYFKSAQWRREMPGVLAVMMRYAARILNDPAALDKANAPEAVQRAERTEVEDQDDVLRWFHEATTECPGGYPSRELYVAFRKWTEETRGLKGFVISEKKWALRMDELIPEDRKDAPNALPRRTGRLRRRQPGPVSWTVTGHAGEPPSSPPSPSSPPPSGGTPGPQPPPPEQPPAAPVPEEPVTSDVAQALPDAQEFGDAPAFESQPEPQAAVKPGKPSRSRLTEEEKAARAAAKEAERLAKATQREEEKLARQAARREELARLKEEARLAKIANLSGPLLPLPALVVRGEPGTAPQVLPCLPEQALVMIEQYLDALCVDCETSGFPVGHKFYELRTIQLGQTAMSVVLDAADPAQAAVAASLLQRARKLHAHSATADIVPCVIAGLIAWEDAWAKMDDSVLIAKLSDPRLTGSDANGLKDLARDILREEATSPPADKARGELFTALGALTETEITTPYERSGWAQVDKHSTTMIRYAGSDVLDLGGVIAKLPQPDPGRMERERGFQGQCARVAKDGFLLDHPHIIAKTEEFARKQEEARQRVFEASGGAIDNPSSPVVGEYLVSQGYQLEASAKTGRPSAAKAQLEPFAQAGDQLCKDILAYRHCVTTRGLLLEPLNALCVHGDGRMRPTVYTINADTGRTSCVRPNGQQFCYSSSTEVLTEYGFMPFPAIDGSQRLAQWSADGTIELVYPEAVLHERYSGPMVRIAGEHHEQVVTPNHRVYSLTRRGQLMVERADSWLAHGALDKIVDRKLIRGGVHTAERLSADELLSLRRAVAVQADGTVRDDCRFIGLGFTKKRKADRARELGLEVRQTGVLAGGKPVHQAKAYEYQVSRWLSLPDKNFRVEELMRLDAEDLREFIAEVMIWDGDATRGREYSQAPERSASVEAVEIAAILCGYSTTRRKKTWNGVDYDCVNLFPKTERWASRTNVEEVSSDGMIHCVTVPSGAVVVRHGGKIVVSGNSRQGGIRACVIADPGMIGISADFSGVEIRVAAALSGDTGLLNAELSTRCLACEHDPCHPACGKKQTGMHWRVARMAWGPDATKEHRYVAKRQVFAKLFGGSPRAGAKQTGTTLEVAQAVHRAFDDLAPVYADWDRYLRGAYKEGTHVWKDPASGQTMGAQLGSGNQGIYRAYSGRDIFINAAHAFGNYAIQGTARELLVDGAQRWGQTRWGHLPILPIHDEILVFVPEAEAQEAVATLQACMQSSLYGVAIAVSADEPFQSWKDSS